MPKTFDMIVVGSGGGQDESNLSAYLIKLCEASWEDGIIALEAGSGKGALSRLLSQQPNLLATDDDVNDAHRNYSADEIYSCVHSFLITHAHLDHVNSLVISAGSLGGVRKRVYARMSTLQNLETIFSGQIWPNLASWEDDDESFKYLYTPLHTDSIYKSISPEISVLTMPLSHGSSEISGTYESSAFFIRHDPSGREFLFFGDVEPDTVANRPYTIRVWLAAAPKIPQILSTIFIECSWASGRPDDLLFGHLNPEHLVAELSALANEVVLARGRNLIEPRNGNKPLRKKHKSNPISSPNLRGVLHGLRIYITHCKDNLDGAYDRSISHVIVDQVKMLVEAQGLGVEILGAEQGMRIEI